MTEWDSSPEGKAYHRKAHQEWRKANKEHANDYHREYMKTWRELNRDRINQKTKEWQIANHEKVKEYRRRYMAKWRDEHREQYREYMKRWKAEHPEGKDTHTMTKEEWLEKYGYPMGDTTGWENWAGWDTRIRKGAEE